MITWKYGKQEGRWCFKILMGSYRVGGRASERGFVVGERRFMTGLALRLEMTRG